MHIDRSEQGKPRVIYLYDLLRNRLRMLPTKVTFVTPIGRGSDVLVRLAPNATGAMDTVRLLKLE